jgi:hypothetical protein
VGPAVKFENVALVIADVNAATRFAEKTNRLPQIFQPPYAFLLDGDSRRIDLPLERRRSVYFLYPSDRDRLDRDRSGRRTRSPA